MSGFGRLLLIFLFTISMQFIEAKGDVEKFWLLEEEFIKLGKKEVYEEGKSASLRNSKDILYPCRGAGQSCPPFWALKALEEPEYIYLYCINNFESLGSFLQAEESSRSKAMSRALLSCISLRYQSLLSLEYSQCKELKRILPMTKDGCASFVFYGVNAESTTDFTAYFTKWMQDFFTESSLSAIFSWKVLLGGDSPRYVIAFFAEDRQVLTQCISKLDEAEEKIKEIIRNKRAVTCDVPAWLWKIMS